MKQGLLSKIAELGKQLPLNTLDELIDKFGGPEKVSEVCISPCHFYFMSECWFSCNVFVVVHL